MTWRAVQVVAAALAFSSVGVSAQSQTTPVRLSHGTAEYSLGIVSYRDIPFRTVVRQQYDYSCGSAALATLLRFHYGRDVGEADVFQAMHRAGDKEAIERVGFSLLDMKRYLEAHGYKADGFRMSIEALEEAAAPAIVVVEQRGYRHFVVVKGIANGRVLVGDPALGLKTYDFEEFGEMWNGVAFMVSDAADRFNRDEEWRPFAKASPETAIPSGSLASMTREMPPLYQITTTFSLDPYLR